MVLASFSYTGPSWIVVGTALAIAVVLAIAAYYIRRIWVGVIAGLLYGGIAGWIVIGMGRGDMTGLLQMLYSPVLGGIGGIIGAIAAGIGKWVVCLTRPKGDSTADEAV